MFVFAGRQPNIEIALPFYRRILAENPDTELHIWDLARSRSDSDYLRTITGDQILVRTEFAGPNPWRSFDKVWQHYAHSMYSQCVFTKLDDDDVFLEVDDYQGFLAAAIDNCDSVVSALTINNGACTPLIPEIWEGFEKLGIPLLDVHLSGAYAELSHFWFCDHWAELVGRTPELIPTEDWLSINCLALSWQALRRIARLNGTIPPPNIAGRTFTRRNRVGDEGAANMIPRLIYTGMVCGHLTFGPQEKRMSAGVLDGVRKLYADVATQYLGVQDFGVQKLNSVAP